MVRFVVLAVGAGLTVGLFLGLVLSCVVVAFMISSQQYKSAGNCMILQLCAVDLILALLGLALSAPSLLQGRWLIAERDSDLSPSFPVTVPEVITAAKSTNILTSPPPSTTRLALLNYDKASSVRPTSNKIPAFGPGLSLEASEAFSRPNDENFGLTSFAPRLSQGVKSSTFSIDDDGAIINPAMNDDDTSRAPSLYFDETTTLSPLTYEDSVPQTDINNEVTTSAPVYSFWDYVVSTDVFSSNSDDSTVVPRYNAENYKVVPEYDTGSSKTELDYVHEDSLVDPMDLTIQPAATLADLTESPDLKYDDAAYKDDASNSQFVYDETEGSAVKYDINYDKSPSLFSNSDGTSPRAKLSAVDTSSVVPDFESLSVSRLMNNEYKATARPLSHSINLPPPGWSPNVLSSALPAVSQLYASSEGYRKNYNDSVNTNNLLVRATKDYDTVKKRSHTEKYGISSQLLYVTGKDDGIGCRLYGGILSLLNLVGVWIVVGIHCDKYCAIASPLRYNQIVTRKRIAVFSLFVWTFSFSVSITLMAVAPSFRYLGGVCLPVFDNAGRLIYTSCLLVVFILSPAAIFLLVNGKILFIARQHQHRIFSAIFEVMMSAQATVTQQRNPFDMPKMKQKSAWAICEQLIGFAMCYCPIVLFLFLECAVHYPINNFLAVVMVGSVLLAPVVNSFLYGIKSVTIRKILKNYLRKKISRSAMKCEIQARIPSAQTSRRPSISSTLGFPAIHRSLQRRMSDYLSPDHVPESDPRELVRRSSEMSWHPLEEGTPTSSRLRQPMDLDFSSDWNPSQVTSASQYLAVPSYEVARCQTNNLRSSSSTESIGTFSMKEPATEDEFIVTSAEISPAFQNKVLANNEASETVRPLAYPFPEDGSLCSNGNIKNTISVSMPLYRKESSTLSSVLSEDPQSTTSATPLLCKAYMTPWPKTETSQSTSPYILRTLESLVSVGISQSRLMKSTSFWRGFSFDKDSSGNLNNNSLDSLEHGRGIELNEKYKCFEIMIGDSVASFPEEETELTETDSPSVIA